MFVADFFAVLVIILVIGGVYLTFFGPEDPWPGALWYFLLLFFGTWAIGVWIQPVQPAAWGYFWIPYLIVAIALALLLAAVMPTPRSPSRTNVPSPRSTEIAEESATEALAVFFWAFLVLAVLALIMNYTYFRPGLPPR
jgi:thiol:disulfide interchange protein